MERRLDYVRGALDDFFLISRRGSSIATEVRGGLTTFLTCAYILLVNGKVMSAAGLPARQVVVATAFSSAAASFLSGLLSNLPVALCPGVGLSVYLVYGCVLSGHLTLAQALTSCLISGALLAFCSASGLAALIMGATPRNVKLAIVSGMGLLISLIGLVSVHVVVANAQTIVGLGSVANPAMWMTLSGVILTGTLIYHEVPGGVLLSIVALTLCEWVSTGDYPASPFEAPRVEVGPARLLDLRPTPAMAPAVLAFLFVGIFDVSGVVFGMANLAGLTSAADGRVPGSLYTFLSCAAGTALASLWGCSPIIVAVESAAGVREGARTGLAGCTTGALFGLSLFLAPVFAAVPQTATAPVLVVVGAMMMGEIKGVDWNAIEEGLPAFLTIALMPFSYSIMDGILFGVASSVAFYFTTGEFLNHLRPALRRLRQGGAPPEGKRLLAGAPPPAAESPSFLDPGRPSRRPSFLLSKAELDDYEDGARQMDRSVAEAGSLARSLS